MDSKQAEEILKNYFKGYEDELSAKGLKFDFEYMKYHSKICSLDELISKHKKEWINALKDCRQYVFALEEDFLDENIKYNVVREFEDDLDDSFDVFGRYFRLEDISTAANIFYLWIDPRLAVLRCYFGLKDDGEDVQDFHNLYVNLKYARLFID